MNKFDDYPEEEHVNLQIRPDSGLMHSRETPSIFDNNEQFEVTGDEEHLREIQEAAYDKFEETTGGTRGDKKEREEEDENPNLERFVEEEQKQYEIPLDDNEYD